MQQFNTLLQSFNAKKLLPVFLMANFMSGMVRKVGAQTTVFTEDFNRASLSTGAPTTYTSTLSPTGAEGAATIPASNYLQITNDGSGTANVAQRLHESTSNPQSVITITGSKL